MVISSLQEADFEPVSISTKGRYDFIATLVKLRRSILGLHNKVFPVYVMNEYVVKYAYNVAVGANTNTIYTVPRGKKAKILSINMSMNVSTTAGLATSNTNIFANGTTNTAIMELNCLGIAAAGMGGVTNTMVLPYEQGIDIQFGDSVTVTNSAGSTATSCITYTEEDV
jgi:hypothetical protein